MNKKRYDYKSILLIAFIIIVSVVVAYAVLSTTLTITTNKITQNPLTWDIGFVGSSATGSASGTSNVGLSCGLATITPTAVTVADTTLSKPGDKCTYELTMKNNGTIDAYTVSVPTAPSGITCSSFEYILTCGNITYELADRANGSPLAPGGFYLNAGDSKTVYLIVKYKANTVQPTPITQSGAKFSFIYEQH